jgi:hypothetical protein
MCDGMYETNLSVPQSLNVNYTITKLLDEVSLNFNKYPAYPDNLKKWLSFWNASNGTQLSWSTLKTNVRPSACMRAISQFLVVAHRCYLTFNL